MNGAHVSLLAVGSVAFDDLETPFGRREKILGGSASYFSLAIHTQFGLSITRT